MKNIIILGSGGFAREVIWLIEDLNKVKMQYHIMGIITNNIDEMEKIEYPYLGNDECLSDYEGKNIGLVIAIGGGKVRKKIAQKLHKKDFDYPNLISKDAVMGNNLKLGQGNIICSQTILTTDIVIGDFNIINLSCTLGHDTVLDDFITVNPGTNISGNVHIGNECEIGTGAKIIQGINISEKTIIGAGGVVVRDTEPDGTYIGVPAKRK